jgi:hypothetical protein
MCVALREDYRVTCSKMYRWFVAKLDITITCRNQMENHYSLGTGLQQ